LTFKEILWELWIWTPFMAEGFAMNILIALVAMVIGTAIGWLVAHMRLSSSPRIHRGSLVLTELTRNTPTIVFQVYLAFMLPNEFTLPLTGTIIVFPAWLKASLALALAVIGFCADNLSTALREWRQGRHGTALLFIPSWTSYALIIVMASSTASVIGVSELVSRCNTVISATGKTQIMLPIYLYACFVFVGFCYPLNSLMKYVKKRIGQNIAEKRHLDTPSVSSISGG
jgi:polar amino acid transport system permease protein